MRKFEEFKDDRELLIQVIRNQAKIAQQLEFQGRKLDVCMKMLNPNQEYVGNQHLDDFLTVMMSEKEILLGEEIYAKAKRLREEQ